MQRAEAHRVKSGQAATAGDQHRLATHLAFFLHASSQGSIDLATLFCMLFSRDHHMHAGKRRFDHGVVQYRKTWEDGVESLTE